MREKKIKSLKIIFEGGDDYSLTCQVGLDKDEVIKYIERVFRPEPAEPLIKDKKIRKAVRAWAEANDIDGASFYTSSHFWYLRTFNDREQGIDFWLKWDDKLNLTEDKYYTIAELCGEEEE